MRDQRPRRRTDRFDQVDLREKLARIDLAHGRQRRDDLLHGEKPLARRLHAFRRGTGSSSRRLRERRQKSAQLARQATGKAHETRQLLGRATERRRRERRRRRRIFSVREDLRELAGVRLALLARFVQLLQERVAFVLLGDAFGRKNQRFGAAIELVTTAVTDRHAREPRALGVRRRRAVGAEDHGETNLVAFAFQRDLRACARAVTDEDVEHAAQLLLVAVHFGSAAGLDRHRSFRRDFPEHRRQIDATTTAPARRRDSWRASRAGAGRARMERGEHPHHVRRAHRAIARRALHRPALHRHHVLPTAAS